MSTVSQIKHFPRRSSTLLAASMTFAVLSLGAVPVKADAQRGFSISSDELWDKCDRSGGTFRMDDNGAYSCHVRRKDGSTTDVVCRKSGLCSGKNEDPKGRGTNAGKASGHTSDGTVSRSRSTRGNTRLRTHTKTRKTVKRRLKKTRRTTRAKTMQRRQGRKIPVQRSPGKQMERKLQ